MALKWLKENSQRAAWLGLRDSAKEIANFDSRNELADRLFV
jgi:hypothetical protein